MHINVNVRLPIARECETDFIQNVLVDIVASGTFGPSSPLHASQAIREPSPEFVVGRVWAERLDWMRAEECGHDVLQICDVSGTWMEVLETISRDGGRTFRKDLNLENFVIDIAFVHEILLHPEIVDRISVLDAALRGLSAENSLILMHYEQTEPHHLDDWECHELGFKKIARSNLLIKDNHFRYPFNDQYVAGRPVKFTATAEHEQWLFERWHDLITDHPSL